MTRTVHHRLPTLPQRLHPAFHTGPGRTRNSYLSLKSSNLSALLMYYSNSIQPVTRHTGAQFRGLGGSCRSSVNVNSVHVGPRLAISSSFLLPSSGYCIFAPLASRCIRFIRCTPLAHPFSTTSLSACDRTQMMARTGSDASDDSDVSQPLGREHWIDVLKSLRKMNVANEFRSVLMAQVTKKEKQKWFKGLMKDGMETWEKRWEGLDAFPVTDAERWSKAEMEQVAKDRIPNWEDAYNHAPVPLCEAGSIPLGSVTKLWATWSHQPWAVHSKWLNVYVYEWFYQLRKYPTSPERFVKMNEYLAKLEDTSGSISTQSSETPDIWDDRRIATDFYIRWYGQLPTDSSQSKEPNRWPTVRKFVHAITCWSSSIDIRVWMMILYGIEARLRESIDINWLRDDEEGISTLHMYQLLAVAFQLFIDCAPAHEGIRQPLTLQGHHQNQTNAGVQGRRLPPRIDTRVGSLEGSQSALQPKSRWDKTPVEPIKLERRPKDWDAEKARRKRVNSVLTNPPQPLSKWKNMLYSPK
ncbi:hypothetical protein T439DRAFT_379608 [Meredithblackwellia eburnea MCA 4105]